MEMGLCLVCDEPLTLDHAMKHKRIRYKVVENDEEVDREFSHKLSTESLKSVEVVNSTPTITKCEEAITTQQTLNSTLVVINHEKPNELISSVSPLNQLHKSLPLTELTPVFTDCLMFDDDDTEKSHGKGQTVASSVLEINTKMECSDEASYVSSDHYETHCALPVWIPTIIPPPEPPDKVTTYVNNYGVFLALVYINSAIRDTITTTEHITSTQQTYLYSISNLQSAFQLFDEMSKCRVAVWNVISRTYMANELQVLASELDCQQDYLAMRNLFVTTVRGEVKFQSPSLFKFNVFVQSVSLCFDTLRCFDPGGLLWFLFSPRYFVSFQFLSRPLLPSVYQFSLISSQTSPTTIEFQTIESSLGHASGWPWVPKVIRIHNKFQVSNDIDQWKVQKFHVEWKGYSITIFVSSSCCWSEHFVKRGMHKSIGEACSHHANVDAYVSIVFTKSIQGWIIFSISFILKCKLLHLLSMFKILTSVVGTVIPSIYSITKVVITLDDWSITCEDIPLPYPFMIRYQYQFYNLNGIALVLGNMLGESWLNVLGKYKDAFVDRGLLVFRHTGTINRTMISVCFGMINLIKNSLSQVGLQGAQMWLVYMVKFNNKLEFPNCNSQMIVELYNIHIWNYLSDPFLDGSISVLTNILCYFNDNAEGRRYVLVSKAGSNEIVSVLVFMKLYSYTIDNCYGFNMISNAIRNFTFECSAMAIDDTFNRIWLLLSVHFAAEIEVFVVVHAIGIERTIRELLYEFIDVLLFECQKYYVMAVLHREMIPRGQLLLLKSLEIFWFDYENATRSLNSIYIMLAIAVCVNNGSVVVTKRMLKWRNLPPKHGTREFYVAAVDVCVVINVIVIVWELWLTHKTLAYLCSAAGSMVAIQLFLNYISKIQGMLCLVVLNDWNPCFITKVWNEPCHFQGASMIQLTASPPILEFLNFIRLKLFATPVSVVAHSSPKRSGIVRNGFAFVAIFHRKMINKGNVRDARVLIKWKALPLKHDTYDCSSLRTRMFEGEGIVTGNNWII